MFRSVRSRSDQSSAALVDIAPLIDIVFILLIFFLVTATFVRDTGVRVTRPQAMMSQPVEQAALRVSITASGDVYVEGQSISLEELTNKVTEFVNQNRQKAVIVIPDEAVLSGRLVEVMDAARMGGAEDVAVATKKKGAAG